MAAPTVVGVGTVASGMASITPPFPGSLADDDILIGIAESVGNEAYPTMPPAGWAHVLGSPVNVDTTTRLTVIWKRFVGGDTALAWGDSGNHNVGRIIAIRGVKTTGNPWNVNPATSLETAANTSAEWPSVTTTVIDCLVVLCIATGRDAASTTNLGLVTNAALGTKTEQMDNWISAGTGGGIGMVTAVKATAGAVGTSTATMGSTDAKALMTIALEPVAEPILGAASGTLTFTGTASGVSLPPGPQITIFEAVWTTSTSPKTVNATGALTGDDLFVLGGGDQSGGNSVTAATTSTTGGTTGSWTEPAEDLSGTVADWITSAIAAVTGDGTVTVQMARTQGGTPAPWGFFAALAKNSGGIGNIATQFTASSTEEVSLTVSQNSAVILLSLDWDSGTVASAWVPSTGAILIERTDLTAYTIHAAYWLAQAAGTRNYGHSGGGGGAYRIIAIEILAASAGETGTAFGAFTFTGAASGTPRTRGTASGALTFTGTAAGKPFVSGQASGTLTFTGSVAGRPRVVAQAAATLTFTGTASGFAGTPPVIGTATAALTFTGTASGHPTTRGTASAAFTFTGSAVGAPRAQGTASASLTFTGTASGIDRAVGTATTTLTFTGIATGRPKVFGQAAASLTFTGNADGFAGTPPVQGQATGTFTFTGSALGRPKVIGQAAATLTFTGSTLGTVEVIGQAAGAFDFTATAIGVREVSGTAEGVLLFVGDASSPPKVTRGAVGGRRRSTSSTHVRIRPTAGVAGLIKRIGSTSGG